MNNVPINQEAAIGLLASIPAALKNFRETRLSGLRPPSEFFDWNQVSKPESINTAISRISYNTRYFSGNYGIIVAALALYAFLTNKWLLIGLAFLVLGFIAINRYAPDATQVGEHTVTQKHLYIGLFVIGIPIIWFAAPIWTFFWIIGASSAIIFTHASFMEPGVESEYSTLEEGGI